MNASSTIGKDKAYLHRFGLRQKGYLELRSNKNKYWVFRWHEYVHGKRIVRHEPVCSVETCPTKQDAERFVQPLRDRLMAGRMSMRRATLKRTKKSRAICSDETYTELVEAQAGRCAICHAPTYRLVIDHDHETGKLRELLCGRCNAGIGLLGDDPGILGNAARYIRSHRAKISDANAHKCTQASS